jgi:U3 small nucleolar RNA-associated protein 3
VQEDSEDVEEEEDESETELDRLVQNLPPALKQRVLRGASAEDAEDENDLLDGDESEEQEEGWGKKKKNYWDGDTADLEIGQEFEDAEDEEEEAKVLFELRVCLIQLNAVVL